MRIQDLLPTKEGLRHGGANIGIIELFQPRTVKVDYFPTLNGSVLSRRSYLFGFGRNASVKASESLTLSNMNKSKLSESFKYLLGSAVVYVAMVSCSSSKGFVDETHATAGTNGATGSGGSTMVQAGMGGMQGTEGMMAMMGGPADGGTEKDATNIMDVLTDPVPDADASEPPTPPDIAVEDCTLTHEVPIAGGKYVYYYAKHDYPGKSVIDLAKLRIINHRTDLQSPTSPVPMGYENTQGAAYIKDGSAIVGCGLVSIPDNGAETNLVSTDKVTFILP